MKSLHDELIEFLTLVLEATKTGLVRWRKAEAPDWYESEGVIGAWARFKYPEYAFGGSDRDFAEVGWDNSPSYRFMVGTRAWDLTVEILSIGMPDEFAQLSSYREALQRGRERLQAALDKCHSRRNETQPGRSD